MSQSAQRVSKLVNVPVLASEASPQDKSSFIKRLQEDGSVVVMVHIPSQHLTDRVSNGTLQVGDGLNDAPSFSTADVGIALYHEVATPTVGASIIILNSQLNSIPLLLKLAKQTVQQIRINLAWVFGYNVLALSMAAGFVSPFGIILTP